MYKLTFATIAQPRVFPTFRYTEYTKPLCHAGRKTTALNAQ